MLDHKAESIEPTKSMSLRATLTIAFVTLSVVTLLLASALELYLNIRSQQEVVYGRQRLIAQDTANAVTDYIQGRFAELESAIKFSNLLESSPTEAEQTLGRLLGLDPAFRQLVYVDTQGQVIANVSRLSQLTGKQLVNQLDPDTLAQTSQGERYFSQVYIDDETFEPLVVIAVPAKNIFGDYLGTLVAETNLKFMWDLVDRLEVGDEGVAYVVDRQGNLLAFGDVTRVIAGENLSQLEVVGKFVDSDDAELALEDTNIGIFTAGIFTGITGNKVLATYVPLETPNWAVVIEIPVAEAYREVIGNVMIFVAIIVLAAVLAGVAGVYLARRLAAPVQRLTDTAAQIAEGNLQLQAPQGEGPTEIRQLAGTFNGMTGQLRDVIESLEDRISARTQRLELVATLSERLVAILNVDQLLSELVNQVKNQFGYYHAHVYLVNQVARSLELRAGSGEVGEQMKAQGHSISLDIRTSLVARAARTREIVSVANVREAEDWLPNPLLPETNSEMAVPIVLEGQVVGVLDVQQNKEGRLDEGDAGLLRSLANQVAVAIHNARLFSEVETALSQAYAAQERYLAQAWDKSRTFRQKAQYLFDPAGSLPATELDELNFGQLQEQVLAEGSRVIVADEKKPQAIAAPIKLSGQTIGTLQIHSSDDGLPWSEDDKAILDAVVDQLAQTAENLRLFDETRRQAGQEQALREITGKLRAAPNLQQLLDIATRELSQRLSATHTRLELGIVSDGPEMNGNVKVGAN